MSPSDRVIIEVGLNENQERSANPHVPYTADELALDAQRCHEAGAAFVHFHARAANGEPRLSDPDLNAAAQRAITTTTPLLCYPSYGDEIRVLDYYDIGVPAPVRYRHLTELVQQGIRVEVAPVDLGSVDSNARWDPATGRLVPSTGLLMNTGEDHRWMLAFCREIGAKPLFTTFDTLHLENLRHLVDWGWVAPSPLFVKHFLAGRSASAKLLRFHCDGLRELFPASEILWMPLVYGADQLPLCELAISLGGHARVGIGDHAYRERGSPTNAELVEEVVRIARAAGREPAAPDEARAMLGIIP